MKKKYFSYFENPFLALRMPRPAYKEQAQHTLRAVREADLGAAFEPLCETLETAINDFDENLTEREESTAGDTRAYHTARANWLEFVDDTYIDYVKPKLRKLDGFADFKPYGKSRLDALTQEDLIVKSNALIELYVEYEDKLYPTLVKDARAKLKAMTDVDEHRDTQDATTDTTILDLADDRRAIALAQRRVKAQLELTFDEPDKVYSFFDFAKATVNKSGKAKPTPKPAAN
ncbi:hypothetical protein Q5H93_04835 [Hymenobacter sp. ASUV-10]|uniref:Uncharacterized protein n=1 Tax=Hymenobacter aranciens TaxID=3063996 RepID=A0ABT9BBW9_9BACT|nr:hypothetical protein [Hymenobacter sp. ASUV-10]MDO7874048.1 hypothetical protein [Hymenobacter sp. ASUV-10]